MASALIGGMLAKGYATASLRIVEISDERRSWIQRELKVAASASIGDSIEGADCIVLAVKPQSVRDVVKELNGKLNAQLLISIAAGIRTLDLSRWLAGYARIIRVMPNTPALVASGISALYAMEGVGQEQKQQAEAMFCAVGSIFWVEKEEQMDAVTAVTGSGPGYVFYFIEALQEAALRLGFSKVQARRLSVETFCGAAIMAKQSLDAVDLLLARVTSKGGTTEAALAHLESQGVKQAIVEAVDKAAQRSRELGNNIADQK